MAGAKVTTVEAFGVGRNVLCSIDGDVLTCKINLKAKGERSKKGEGPNIVVATTGGNVTIPGTGGGKLGVNFYVPA